LPPLQVLESLLAETSHAFESKSRRLGMVAETVLNDINTNFHSSAGELQRLIPIQRQAGAACGAVLQAVAGSGIALWAG
jgi:hypothetical protein